jgi:hypothetical protein
MAGNTASLAQRQPRSAALGAPARKPLYLATRNPVHIDAGATWLVLRRTDAPTARYPLARISRIVCNQNANWSGAALALCLRHQIPVAWVDGRGRPLGSALSRLGKCDPLGVALESYVELPDWPARFDNWLARRRLEVLTTCAVRALRESRAPDAAAFAELKRQYVHNRTHPRGFCPEAEGWCHALVVSRLHERGVHTRYWGYDGQPMEIADELCALLWAELNIECGAMPAAADGGRTLMLMFESWAHGHEARLLAHLADLHRHVAREVEAWH